MDDLEAEGSELSLRAARYIRIKRQSEEAMEREKRRLAQLLYNRPNDPQHSEGQS